MIKFFRKIRQNLISEGKTGKYLKYAIGEIILVVIGILIALQINNWNEVRKDKIAELNKELGEMKAKEKSAVNGEGKYTAVGIGKKADGKLHTFTFLFDPDTGYSEIVEEKDYGMDIYLAEHYMRDVITSKIILPFMRGER